MAEGAATLRVAMVGCGFMGAAHSQAWQLVGRHLPASAPRPQLAVLAGRQRDVLGEAARRWGWAEWETDWRRLIERDDIDLIDICTPSDTHVEIATAALEAGKHVLCEKPLANSVADAAAVAATAASARERGVFAMVSFNYRRVPALRKAQRLIADGKLGAIRHIRGVYLQDWLRDRNLPATWRLQAERAGSGALGDLGSHLIDLAHFLLGERLVEVNATSATFVLKRPLAGEPGTLMSVGVDDAAALFARTPSGALVTLEATRYATGRKNALRLEINGETGSLAFDLERLNELEWYDTAGTPGFARVMTTEPEDPYLDMWWPPGHVLGWVDTFVHQIYDLVTGIASGVAPNPDFADGLAVQEVLESARRAASRHNSPAS